MACSLATMSQNEEKKRKKTKKKRKKKQTAPTKRGYGGTLQKKRGMGKTNLRGSGLIQQEIVLRPPG